MPSAAAPPRAPTATQALALPEPPQALVSLGEGDPPSAAPTYFPAEYAAGYLSDAEVAGCESMAVGLPPRVVDASLLRGMKQVRGAGPSVACSVWRMVALRGGVHQESRVLANSAHPAAFMLAPTPLTLTTAHLLQSDFVGHISNPTQHPMLACPTLASSPYPQHAVRLCGLHPQPALPARRALRRRHARRRRAAQPARAAAARPQRAG